MLNPVKFSAYFIANSLRGAQNVVEHYKNRGALNEVIAIEVDYGEKKLGAVLTGDHADLYLAAQAAEEANITEVGRSVSHLSWLG